MESRVNPCKSTEMAMFYLRTTQDMNVIMIHYELRNNRIWNKKYLIMFFFFFCES